MKPISLLSNRRNFALVIIVLSIALTNCRKKSTTILMIYSESVATNKAEANVNINVYQQNGYSTGVILK